MMVVIDGSVSNEGNREEGFDDIVVDDKTFEKWFVCHGVPQFSNGYLPSSRRLLFLAVSLLALSLFEIVVAPLLQLTAEHLVLLPPLVIWSVLLLSPSAAAVLGRPGGSRHWWRPPLGLIVFGFGLYLLAHGRGPGLWSDTWITFWIFVLALGSVTLIVIRGRKGPLAQRRLCLTLLAPAAIVLFAMDGSLFEPLDRFLGRPLYGVPGRLPALVVMIAILAVCVLVFRAPLGTDKTRPIPVLVAGFAATPMLVLLFVAEAVMLPVYVKHEIIQVLLPVGLMLACFLVAGIAVNRHPSGPMPFIGFSNLDRIGKLIWDPCRRRPRMLVYLAILISLAIYPAVIWAYADLAVLGTTVSGWRAAVVMVGVNICYIFLTFLFVRLGLDRICAWAVKQIWRKRTEIARGLVRGLPLLLVFATFFVLTAETWQVAVAEANGWGFIGLSGLLIALTLLFLAVMARQELKTQSAFDDWSTVKKCALRPNKDGTPESTVAHFAKVFDDKPPLGADLSPDIRKMARVNAFLVVGVYQALIFVPLTIVAAVLFWLIGKLAVTNAVATQWIYGDGAGESEKAKLAAKPFLEEPWTRVPLILAAFSLFYLTVTVLTDDKQQSMFFSGSRDSLRQRFALRIAYLACCVRRHVQPPSAVNGASPRPAGSVAGFSSQLPRQRVEPDGASALSDTSFMW